MKPQTYAIALAMFAASLFFGVIGANVLLDPTGVFGTNLLPPSLNFNDRYAKFAQYQLQPDRYDGLFFGSSRTNAIPVDELSRHMPGVTFANFGVVGGMLADHLSTLDFVLREKLSRGRRIKAVFVLLDADLFGRRPFANEALQFAQPPALSGESPLRFWWRNLMAIQFRVWRSRLKEYLDIGRTAGLPNPSSTRRDILTTIISSAGVATAHAEPAAQNQPAAILPPAPEKITEQPLYPQHLELWTNFVTLCRSQGIALTVAISPLSHDMAAGFDRADLSKAIDDIAQLAPVWDFSDAGWIADDPKLWHDTSHFTAEVGRMMIARMFGEPTPPQWSSFGRLRSGRALALGERRVQ